MASSLMHVLYLLATLIYVCGAQGIIGFTVGIGETNCVLKKAIREGDIIVFKATLAKTSNDSDWFLFFVSAVTKNKASTPKVVAEMFLKRCVTSIMALSKADNASCLMLDDRVYVTLEMKAQMWMSGMDYFASWVHIQKGTVKSKSMSGPKVVGLAREKLMLNDDEIDLESGSMKLKPNMPNELKYCVKGLLKHTLTVQVNGKITNSALDCVETALSTEDRTFVSLGYDELEGDCKQAYRHLFVLKNGDGVVIEVPRIFQRSTSDNGASPATSDFTGLLAAILFFWICIYISN
uniref:Uncharacterized protein n=1 Tax=Biomphalaria glabrata TaxID=6526 RepID=A0A2C9L1R0_BIOGL